MINFKRTWTLVKLSSREAVLLMKLPILSSYISKSIAPVQGKRSMNTSPPLRKRAALQVATAVNVQESPYSDLSSTLTLANIRKQLILMEDTIIFALVERSQFARNNPIYMAGGVPIPGYTPEGRQLTLLEWLLRETEQVHGRIRRYTSPEENAYFPNELPPLVLPPMTYPQVLASCASDVNINPKIMDMYITAILPEITEDGDDRNYGSAAMYDVMILQALSRRIHYGKYVAEAKFRAHTEQYTTLIKNGDADGILALLTDRTVELKVIERVCLKAATFGQDLNSISKSTGNGMNVNEFKIKPNAVGELYEQLVMPLTKEVEVLYLLKRLDS